MLITTTDDLMKYVEVSTDLDIRSVTPSIKKAERRFIIPILGAFYNEVQTMVDTPTAVPLEVELIDLINSATGPLAMWYYVQIGGVSIDNSGIYKPKNGERWNLGDNEQKNLENYLLSTGLDALDDLLNFLNTNADSFERYRDSVEFADAFNTLVPTASIVQRVFALLHPQVTYRAMREAIRYVEPRVAAAMQEFYQHVITSKDDDLTAAEKRQREHARKAVIYVATSRALLTRTVKLTNEGLEVMMGDRTQISEPENARIESSAREFAQSGEVSLQALIEDMNAVPPTGYVVPVAAEITLRSKAPEGSKVVFF